MRKKVKHSLNSIKVYELAIDGRVYNAGYTIPEIAKLTGLNDETVRLILKQHEKEGYIVRDELTKSPIFFHRGPWANVMDEVVAKTKLEYTGGANSSLEGGCEDQEKVNRSRSKTMAVHTLRTHQNGHVRFDVLRIGDMHRIIVPDGRGGHTEIPLFPKSPNRDHHNQSWFAELKFENKPVNIHLFDSKSVTYIIVPPPEVELTRTQISSANEILIIRAKQVVSILTKFGGWQLGEPTLIGTTEYSDTDSPLLFLMPPIPKSDGLDIWTDGSHGKEEAETDDPKMVDFIVDPLGKENRSELTTQEIISRLSALEQIACHNTLAVGKLVQSQQLEFDAAKAAHGYNHSEKLKEGLQTYDSAPVYSTDYEVMYR